MDKVVLSDACSVLSVTCMGLHCPRPDFVAAAGGKSSRGRRSCSIHGQNRLQQIILYTLRALVAWQVRRYASERAAQMKLASMSR